MKTIKADYKFLTLIFLSIGFIFSVAEPIAKGFIIPFGILFVLNVALCAAFGWKY